MSDVMDVGSIVVERDGHRAVFNGSWYRGRHASFIPSKAELRQARAFDRYVMDGHAPPAPFLEKSTPITAIGSCFAANISRHLGERGYAVFGRHYDLDAHIIRFGEGMANSFAIRQQFEWALEGREFPQSLWLGAGKEIARKDAAIREETRDIIAATQVFIITLGLAEIWYDKPSGEAFWRAVPAKVFDARRHGFRVTSVEENARNLAVTLDLIFAARPDASVILTLSPIPLMATFRPVSCLTANAVSKATMRLAIETVMAERRKRVFYYPAYEMVTGASFDPMEEDNRHPRREVVDAVMACFERHYCRADDSNPQTP